MGHLRRLGTYAICLAAAGAVPALADSHPAAVSTTYYASASSTADSPCTQSAPCRLDHAVEAAQPGDTVIVLSGSYSVSYGVSTNNPITIEGEPGAPRPSLVATPGLSANTLTVSGGATVRHLDIATAPGTNAHQHVAALSIAGGTAEDLTLTASAGDTQGEALSVGDWSGGTLVRNVLATSQAASGYVVSVQDSGQPGTASVYNLTAVAGHATSAIVYGNMAKGTALIKDSILAGQSSAVASNSGTAPVQIAYSDFSATGSSGFTDGGGNISASPVFADDSAGNYREAPASPTIDAGAPDTQLAATDLDGNPRLQGPAPDMGAYEYAASSPSSTGSGEGPEPTTAPSPVLGQSVALSPLAGEVFVKAPHGSFRTLSAAATVPVGSVIDVTRGEVALTSVINRSGETRSGTFQGGKFVVRQRTTGADLTDLRLSGGSFAPCHRHVTHTFMSRPGHHKSHHVVRQLWGSDNGGHFATIGRTASAAVRGTVWLTVDRCDGTWVKVFKGHVVVRDRRHRRVITLGPGQSYLARAHH